MIFEQASYALATQTPDAPGRCPLRSSSCFNAPRGPVANHKNAAE